MSNYTYPHSLPVELLPVLEFGLGLVWPNIIQWNKSTPLPILVFVPSTDISWCQCKTSSTSPKYNQITKNGRRENHSHSYFPIIFNDLAQILIEIERKLLNSPIFIPSHKSIRLVTISEFFDWVDIYIIIFLQLFYWLEKASFEQNNEILSNQFIITHINPSDEYVSWFRLGISRLSF